MTKNTHFLKILAYTPHKSPKHPLQDLLVRMHEMVKVQKFTES